MTECLDKDGKELKKGFYKEINSKTWYYFSEEYDDDENPILKDFYKNDFYMFPSDSTRRLKRITKEEIKTRINWLEKGLSQAN